jgi:DNA-binding Lrp family transcriptional regulator
MSVRNAEGWAEAVPWQRLSPRSKETKERIATLIADGHTQEEVAELVGLDVREVTRAMAELREESRALVEGAVLPALAPDTREALRDSLARLGQLVPVLVDEHGEPLDGANRLALCAELGIEPLLRVVDTHGDPERAREIKLAANTVRRMWSAASRQQAIVAELTRDPSRSDRAIAAELGTDHHAIGKARRELEQRGSILRLRTRVGRDGVRQVAAKAQPRRPLARSESSPPPTQEVAPAAARLGCRVEVDPGDTSGGRLAFVGDVRLELPESIWQALGRPLALDVAIAAR